MYGFRGLLLSWFSSYLANRRQRVFVGSSASEYGSVKWGVPQGSVLGPVLFLLYVNDLTNLRIQGKFTLFADDTTVLWHGPNSGSLHATLSGELQMLRDWFDSNLLSLNHGKTKIVCFKGHIDDVYIGGIPISQHTSSKFLGLIIDNELKFEPHIIALAKKISAGCFAVRVTAQELGAAVGRSVYFALIESRLRYGICFWGSASNYLVQLLFVMQKRALRYICSAKPRDSCRPLFIQESILTITCIYILEIASQTYKNRNKFMAENPRYVTRQLYNLQLPIPTSTLTQKSIFYEGIKVFNHLPRNIREAGSFNVFRRRLKSFLVGKAYYSLLEFYGDIF